MKKDDLYLSEEETERVFDREWRVDFREALPSCAARNALVKASADYAVIKVIEDIQRVVDDAPYSMKILSVTKYLRELEKLVEG